jgi:hypothetical protein
LIHPKIKEKEKQSRKTILESVSKSGSKNEKSSEKIQYWSPVLLTKKKKKTDFNLISGSIPVLIKIIFFCLWFNHC